MSCYKGKYTDELIATYFIVGWLLPVDDSAFPSDKSRYLCQLPDPELEPTDGPDAGPSWVTLEAGISRLESIHKATFLVRMHELK